MSKLWTELSKIGLEIKANEFVDVLGSLSSGKAFYLTQSASDEP